MNIFKTFILFLTATKYSFAFCFRNAKGDTLVRLALAIANIVLLYLTIHTTGVVINNIQHLSKAAVHTKLSLADFMASDCFTSILGLAAIFVIGVIVGKLNWFYKSRLMFSLRYANQREYNDHKARLDIAKFRSQKYDDLLKRIGELPQAWQTRTYLADEMVNLFTLVVSFIVFGSSLLWYSPYFAGAIFFTSIPMMASEFSMVTKWWAVMEKLVPHHKKRHVLERAYTDKNIFAQALMFRQMPVLRRQIDRNTDEVSSQYETLRWLVVKYETLAELVSVIGLSGVIAYAVWLTVSGSQTIGTLTIIIAASQTFQRNIQSIVNSMADQWNSAKGVVLIEEEFFGMLPTLRTTDPVKPDFKSIPKIRFEKVSFAYPDTDTLVLKDISFTIEPGSKVAIVGKSGHGKSSLAALLMRHYDPTSGGIYVDDINLHSITPEDWSECASALMQDYSVCERTVAEEIASSRLDAPLDLEIVAASSRFAHFDEVIEMDPKGFESQIGTDHGGREFSGGEKQRLALARVRYRGTPILLLDEPDAKLDPDSAQKVMDNIFALKGVTVVLITHHVSRAERCDKIIMMGRAEIIEQGSHRELMARQSAYAKMFEKDKKRLTGGH